MGETSRFFFYTFCFSSLEVVKNEQGQDEIGFTSIEVAGQVQKINDAINQLTHTNHDTYMMLLTARIVKGVLIYTWLLMMNCFFIQSIICYR